MFISSSAEAIFPFGLWSDKMSEVCLSELLSFTSISILFSGDLTLEDMSSAGVAAVAGSALFGGAATSAGLATEVGAAADAGIPSVKS